MTRSVLIKLFIEERSFELMLLMMLFLSKMLKVYKV